LGRSVDSTLQRFDLTIQRRCSQLILNTFDRLVLEPCVSLFLMPMRKLTFRERCTFLAACLRLHRSMVLEFTLIGAVVGAVFAWALPPTFGSFVKVEVDRMCPHGIRSELCAGCPRCLEDRTPMLVKWGRALDRRALNAGLTNAQMESYAQQLLDFVK
jgi:hypothetical protein